MITRHVSSQFFSLFTLVWVTGLLLLIAPPAWADLYTFTADTTIDPNDATYDGHDIIVDGCVVTIDGAHPFNSLQIVNGGVVTHSANADTHVYTLDLTIATDVMIDPNSMIDVSGKGYIRAQGPGAGGYSSGYGSGGGYGGNGGTVYDGYPGGDAYGLIITPTDIGSGGGHDSAGGSGGGAIRLDIGGTLTVEGIVAANGANGGTWGGGGSGGSVYITAATVTGSGTISAVGGDSGYLIYAGGGGGGRIALFADFGGCSWHTPAHGGDGYMRGGAGTAYFKEPAQATGVVVVDNDGVAGAWTPLTSPEAFDLAIRHSAIAAPESPMTVGDLMVNHDSILTHSAGGPGFNLTVQGDAIIDPNAAIDVTGRGYGAASGPGAGTTHTSYGAGAGYGGEGGRSQYVAGGVGYGSILTPVDLGSGGGNGSAGSRGAGGGAIRLNVGGTLTVDGSLTADGNNAGINAGGGSGGSIYLTVGTLAGVGAISANGGLPGQAVYAGAGGGGRIAIEYSANSFTGAVSALGGNNGWERGGAGTIYTKDSAASVGDLLVDNGANVGAWTPFTSPEAFNLTVANGAIVYPTAPMTIGDLDIAAGGLLTHLSEDAGFNLTVQGDAVIDPNAAIDVSGRGHGAASGPGAGTTHTSYGGGAGYGGEGGRSQYVAGGVGYGSILTPVDLGSGGGNGSAGSGGAGGGAIRLSVAGTLTIDGSLTADGNNAGSNAGGGSGGSVYLTVGTLAGAGAISANGGLSGQAVYAGAGGGGRIAIEYDTNSFAGTMSAVGGNSGWERGGAGTIYTKDSAASVGELLVDNGANVGAWTPLTSPEAFDLTIANGAIAYPTAALSLTNLRVSANGQLTHLSEDSGFDVTVQADATIDVDGALAADGRGYPADTGPGAGSTGGGYASGAGYGGEGGNSNYNYAAGGSAYALDSVVAPVDFGSGGGSGSYSTGGAGGGVIRLDVAGTLTVDGQLSANGAVGYNAYGGGGSGGSLYLTVSTLAGAGTVSANGGDGGSPEHSGGGGGGRIAIYYAADTFTGTRSANGGNGAQAGGAGTIYTEDTSRAMGEVLVDNAGNSGAWTPLTTPIVFDLTIRNSAIAYPAAALTVNNLYVAANGLLTHPSEDAGFDVTVQADATIDVDSALAADGKGHPADTGPGAGLVGGGFGSGAGYGGNGGATYQNYAAGGSAYALDSIAAPADLGSGGGSGSGSSGGAGGGQILLNVTGTLTVEGRLGVNGAAGTGTYGGGGSGGSLHLTVGTLAGAGAISADGGDGGNSYYAGGGGGGRLAVHTATDNFAGTISACGGDGATYGGAGSVYILRGAGPADLVFDNGGNSGAWTPVITPAVFDVTIANAAIVYPVESLLVGDLDVEDAGLLTHEAGSAEFSLQVEGDATVDVGGAISADAKGYAAGSGPGAGDVGSGFGSGAGYGGRGGDAYNHYAPGGDPYGNAPKPEDLGSGGGSGSGFVGGAGGGFMRMTVAGTLQVDGVLSVDGGAGWGTYAGGGSGGGLFVKAGTIDGAGTIAANGGDAGNPSYSGGGGGGRIALFTCDLLMPFEQIAVAGGAGWENGGDGTVYTGSATVEITQQPESQVVAYGETAEFHVAAIGDGTLSYQWRHNGVDLVDDDRISGSQTPDLSIADIEFCDMGAYDVVVTDDCGGFPSDSAWLQVWNSGDLDGDADVDLADLAQLLSNYGITGGATWEQGDLDGDGDVDLSDLATLLSVYGRVCE